MKRVMITGAQGQLGLALRKLLQECEDYEPYLTDAFTNEDKNIAALDITQEEAVKEYVSAYKPDIIINCAAFTAVDLCETEQDKAYQINALGPKYLAEAAERIGARLIHISTDYVFDGESREPITEDAETNPVSVYGKTKLEGERNVIRSCSRYFILRTAWLYGEGKNFVKTMLRLAENGSKIRVVADQYGTPTSAIELARVILFLMKTESYGIYHTTCEGSTSWYEFAKIIFETAGMQVEVEAIETREYITPAKRPSYSVLDNKALRERHGYYMKDWKEAFYEYMKGEA
jgi:dTDP-4-dehydrorhamnose reductase